MEICDYPLMCYWGGEISNVNGVVSYRGGHECFVLGNSMMKYDDLLREIYNGMGMENMETQLSLKMKFPSLGCYKVVPLCNDHGLRALWGVVRHSNSPSIDLYVELSCSQVIEPMNNQSFPSIMRLDDVTQFVSIETNNVNEGVFDGNIEGDEVDDELNNLDEILVDAGEEGDDDDVGITAPVNDFNRIHELDDKHLSSWKTWENLARHEEGGEFAVGQRFPNKVMVVEAVTKYCLQRNQTYKVVESKSHTITFKCGRAPSPCTWRLRASQKEVHTEAFQIVTYNGSHLPSCVSDNVRRDHINLKHGFISNAIKNLVQADWGMKVSLIVEFLEDKYNHAISYSKAWNAKQRAIANIFGDWDKSYEVLPHLMQALKATNPGTMYQFSNIPTQNPNVQIFRRLFWAFGPSIQGFAHCRPLITIDGTHLYGKYKGTVLTAMGVDANNQIFPLAFAVVESENNDSWPWFMACIRTYVTKRHGLCVISDRHAGIMKAMNEVNSGWEQPFAYHRLCMRHLASNVNTRFKNRVVKNLFGFTATQPQEKKFNHGLTRLGGVSAEAQKYVTDVGFDKWSICRDGGRRFGLLTTNMAEAFNNVLKGARFLPITALVKLTFYRVNAYFVERREMAKKRLMEGVVYSAKISAILEVNQAKAAHHKVVTFDRGEGVYQVTTGRGHRVSSKGNHVHTVDLKRKTCTCNKLQVYKYPCSHLFAVCRKESLSTSQFVDSGYTTGEHLASYAPKFQPMLDEAYWGPYIGPNMVSDQSRKRGKGRPMSKRLRNEMDEKSSSTVSCCLCRGKGHNKKTCSLRNTSGGNGSNGTSNTPRSTSLGGLPDSQHRSLITSDGSSYT